MLNNASSANFALRAAALTTVLSMTLGSVAQAATTIRPVPLAVGRVAAHAGAPSPQWILSHLQQYGTAPRNAIGQTSYPLNGPWGLTVSPSGNLLVANLRANQVLIYNSNLQQQTSSTVTSNLSEPTGVAFDSAGEMYVSNLGSSRVTVYSPSVHTYIPNRDIVQNVNRPSSIAIDGLDNLYVDNNFSSVGVYYYNGAYDGTLPVPSNAGSIDAIAQRAHFTAVAGSAQVQVGPTTSMLETLFNGIPEFTNGNSVNMARGVTFDSNDNLYYVTDDNAVYFQNQVTHATTTFAQLSFDPESIAVDIAHNHVFVSDFHNNAIAVYNLSGQLITTLH